MNECRPGARPVATTSVWDGCDWGTWTKQVSVAVWHRSDSGQHRRNRSVGTINTVAAFGEPGPSPTCHHGESRVKALRLAVSTESPRRCCHQQNLPILIRVRVLPEARERSTSSSTPSNPAPNRHLFRFPTALWPIPWESFGYSCHCRCAAVASCDSRGLQSTIVQVCSDGQRNQRTRPGQGR